MQCGDMLVVVRRRLSVCSVVHVDVPFRQDRVVFLLLLSLSSVRVDGPIQPTTVVLFSYFAQSRLYFLFNIISSSPV